jgi:hypothetical protein
MIAGLFEGPAWLLAKFYDLTNNYILAIAMIALVVMLITAPLQLKATKGCSRCSGSSRRCASSSRSTAATGRSSTKR